MTLPRYEAICDHWERIPPLSVSASVIAQSLGASKPKAKAQKGGQKPQAQGNSVNDRQALFDMLGGAGFSTEKPEWLASTK